ncbi:MAG: CHASE domain-containing protein, partial [Phycisphaerales bacterium]
MRERSRSPASHVTQQDARLRAGISPRQVILLILLASAGIAASTLLCVALRREEQAKLRTSFEQTARERISELKAHIEESLHALDWVAGLHNNLTEVNRLEFRGFVQPYLAHHPEIHALGWVPRIPDAQRAVYEAAAREDGCIDFEFNERTSQGQMARAARRQEYYPVSFIEPISANEAALGFDLGCDPVLADCLRWARDNGQPSVSNPVMLGQRTGGQCGVFAFKPVYHKGAPCDSIENRRKNLDGFAIVAVEMSFFLDEVMSHFEPFGMDVHLCDPSAPHGRCQLGSHLSRTCTPADDAAFGPCPALRASESAGPRSSAILPVANRKWVVLCTALPALLAKTRTSIPWITMVSGLGFTGLLTVLALVIFQRIARSKLFTAELVISQQKLKSEIAEREKAEQELLASEERYRNIFNSACEAILVIDSNGRIIGANPKASQIYGYLPEEFAGVPAKKLIHPDDGHVLDEHVAILAGTGEFRAEYRGIRKDGTTIHVEVSTTTTMYEGNKHLLSIVNDVTAHKRAEQERENLARFPRENPNPVLRISDAGVVLFANEASRPVLQTWAIQQGQKVPHDCCTRIEEMVASGTLCSFEFICSNGRIFLMTLTPIAEAGYVNAYGLDITERRKVEEALDRLNRDLESANQELTRTNKELQEFAYIAAHDLKT